MVHARVSGGLPVQAQVNAASMPVSTVCGLGSDNSLGPTTERTRQSSVFKIKYTHAYNYSIKHVALLTPPQNAAFDAICLKAHLQLVMPVRL